VAGQESDLFRQKNTGKRAALSAMIAGIEISFYIIVHAFSRRVPFSTRNEYDHKRMLSIMYTY
jgi:hypothetical protein